MYAYRVGDLYTPGRTSWPEAGEYNYRAGAHELRLFYPRLKETEIKAITRRPAEFGAAQVGPILVFLYKFSADSHWSDAPYNWHILKAARPDEATIPPPLEENERVLLNIVLVEATTGIIAGLRSVSLSTALSRYLHTEIANQIQQPFDALDYDAELKRLYAATTSDALARVAERCRIV